MKTKTSRKAGFTLVEIMIVVAIIGLLAAIAIPNFVRARSTAQMNACINNLRQIDSAKQQWALEKGKASTDTPLDGEVAAYIGRAGTLLSLPSCPLSGQPAGQAGFDASYTINQCGTAPTCKIQGVGIGDQNYIHVLPN
ncbi:MAG: type II secretion system protein [Verrucomicrobiota bacterium]|jgi:prepilin-type N-terminal cleavage/methylation domain-containing protein